jgi:hypothetical protein
MALTYEIVHLFDDDMPLIRKSSMVRSHVSSLELASSLKRTQRTPPQHKKEKSHEHDQKNSLTSFLNVPYLNSKKNYNQLTSYRLRISSNSSTSTAKFSSSKKCKFKFNGVPIRFFYVDKVQQSKQVKV